MSAQENKSDVSRLREQIEDEIQSLAMMNQFGITGSHAIIDHKFRQVDSSIRQLSEHIGEQEANTYACETYVNKVG